MITTDETIQKLKFYDELLVLLSVGRMLKIMRREVGLNKDIKDATTMLGFMINETYKSEMQMMYIKCEYSRIRVLHMMWLNKLFGFVWVKKVFYFIIKPILVLPILTVAILIKRIIFNPLVKLINYIKK